MKTFMTITAILTITLLTQLTHSRSFQNTESSHTVDQTCTESRLLTLAACGCYIQATMTGASKQEIGLCNRQFGEDLRRLKTHCEKFESEEGVVDENGVMEAVIEVQRTCFREMENVEVDGVDEKGLQYTERMLPYVMRSSLFMVPGLIKACQSGVTKEDLAK